LTEPHRTLINKIASEVVDEVNIEQELAGQTEEYQSAFREILGKKKKQVTHAEDPNVRIYTCIPNVEVAIVYSPDLKKEYMTFNGKIVYSIELAMDILEGNISSPNFSRECPTGINYIAIQPVPNCPEWVKIERHITTDPRYSPFCTFVKLSGGLELTSLPN
jgi:hypothetical protein